VFVAVRVRRDRFDDPHFRATAANADGESLQMLACATHMCRSVKILISALLVLAACSSDQAQRDQPIKSQPQALLTGTLHRHMRNCPSGVESATTQSTPTADGVELTITSSDSDAQSEILARAMLQSLQRDPMTNAVQHTGDHRGPGSIGFCPIIHADTRVSFEPIANGVRVHVTAHRLRDVAALQEATSARVRAIVPVVSL
jgi:hypothetical protein